MSALSLSEDKLWKYTRTLLSWHYRQNSCIVQSSANKQLRRQTQGRERQQHICLCPPSKETTILDLCRVTGHYIVLMFCAVPYAVRVHKWEGKTSFSMQISSPCCSLMQGQEGRWDSGLLYPLASRASLGKGVNAEELVQWPCSV